MKKSRKSKIKEWLHKCFAHSYNMNIVKYLMLPATEREKYIDMMELVLGDFLSTIDRQSVISITISEWFGGLSRKAN